MKATEAANQMLEAEYIVTKLPTQAVEQESTHPANTAMIDELTNFSSVMIYEHPFPGIPTRALWHEENVRHFAELLRRLR